MIRQLASGVRLLVALVLLFSIVAIAAVPASAGTVVVNFVRVSPTTAGSVAGYTANVTLPLGASSVLGDTIMITFPEEVIMPATVSYQAVSINGVAFASSDAAPYVSGQSLILTLNAAQAAAIAGSGGPMAEIVISPAAGIKNPGIAKTAASGAYRLSVVTSRDTTSGSKAYGIIPTYSISPTSGDRTTEVTVTGQGWGPNLSIMISNGLTGVGIADADGAFTLTATAGSGNGGAVNCADGAGQTQAGGSVTWDSAVTVPTYTLLPRVSVSPTSGNVGSTFYVLGYDFTPGGTIASASVTLANTYVNANAGASFTLITRDVYGTLDDAYFACSVPNTMSGGAKLVSVTDSGGRTATGTFTVNTPTITLDPASGAPNTLVTITGSNFRAGDAIFIGGLTFAGWAWNYVTITVDSSGSWTFVARVPATAVAGTNPVIVISASGTAASAVFTASARALTLSPSSGPKGTKVTVSGSNMTASGIIWVGGLTFGGANWNTAAAITIDSQGKISPTTLRVPSGSATGPNTVGAVDSGSLTATAVFTVTQPTISISPTSGYKGQTLTVAGAGWVPGSLGLVSVTFNAVTKMVVTPKADGTFIALFTVPVTAVSRQLVGASDTYGNSAASKAFVILDPLLSVDPGSGPAGTNVTVTGMGFQPQTAVSALTIGGVSVLPCDGPLVTNTMGGFELTFSAPALSEGGKQVSATVAAVTVSTHFTIDPGPGQPDPPAGPPGLSLSPTSGPAGTEVTATGTEFLQFSGLTSLTIDGVAVSPCCTPVVTDGDGDFETTFTVPVLARGSKTVSATIAGATAVTTFTIAPGPEQPGPPAGPAVVSVSPAAGPPGTEVTITGTEFMPLSGLTSLTIGGVNVLPHCPPVVTDDGGDFTIAIAIPGLAVGAQTVMATVSGTSATTFITVTEPPSSAATQLAGISTELIRVWGYAPATGWQMYDPGDPIGSDLAALVEGNGYWIKVTDDCTLLHGGHSWELTEGWNLIGWLGSDQGADSAESNGTDQGLELPYRLHGEAHLDGTAVPDGTVIAATIDGDTYTATTPSAYGASTYQITIAPAEGTSYAEGTTIAFTIGDTPADQIGSWEAGGNTELNLTASSPPPPEVSTGCATDVWDDSPTLNGTLLSLGTASSVEVSFEWGLDTTYGNQTSSLTMTEPGVFAIEVADLQPYVTYHFRAKAVGDDIGYGDDMCLVRFIPGDANMDGIVDGRDVIRVKKIILGID